MVEFKICHECMSSRCYCTFMQQVRRFYWVWFKLQPFSIFSEFLVQNTLEPPFNRINNGRVFDRQVYAWLTFTLGACYVIIIQWGLSRIIVLLQSQSQGLGIQQFPPPSYPFVPPSFLLDCLSIATWQTLRPDSERQAETIKHDIKSIFHIKLPR